MAYTVVAFVISLLLLSLAVTLNRAQAQRAEQRRPYRDDQFDLQVWQVRQAAKQRAKLAAGGNSSIAANQQFARVQSLNEQLRQQEDLFASSSLPSPYEMLSFRGFAGQLPQPVKEAELRGACSFRGARCAMEAVEHSLVRRFLKHDDAVLELGARFGTTSCEIASVQRNSG
eukprot:gene31991-38682_t